MDSVVVLVVASGDALAAGAAVSVFCSHAASSAAPARIQINRFIIIKDQFNAVSQQEGFSAVRFRKVLRISSRAPQPLPDKSACPREY